jgi:hypothetical protein
MKRIYSLLYNCDPGNSLGGSCQNDLRNVKRILDNIDGYMHTTYIHSTDQFKDICDGFIYNILQDDIVLIYLSGHGYQIPNKNLDELGEVDGMDEYINTPFGMVLDDDIKGLIINQLPKGVKFIGVADLCHSGTMFDIFDRLTNNIKYNCLSVGACLDAELESCDVGDVIGFGGSLTIQLLESKINGHCLLEHIIRYFDDAGEIIKVESILRDKLIVFGQHPVINVLAHR